MVHRIFATSVASVFRCTWSGSTARGAPLLSAMTIEDPLTQEIRWPDTLVDELATGESLAEMLPADQREGPARWAVNQSPACWVHPERSHSRRTRDPLGCGTENLWVHVHFTMLHLGRRRRSGTRWRIHRRVRPSAPYGSSTVLAKSQEPRDAAAADAPQITRVLGVQGQSALPSAGGSSGTR